MDEAGEWSPDEPSETEAFEQWDEALDEGDLAGMADPDSPEGDGTLDGQLILDEVELEEIGAELEDPEKLAVLEGGMDDPDGADIPPAARREPPGSEGWDLSGSCQERDA